MVPLPYGSITLWFHYLMVPLAVFFRFYLVLDDPGWVLIGSVYAQAPFWNSHIQQIVPRSMIQWMGKNKDTSCTDHLIISDPSFRCASWLRHSKMQQFHQWTEAPRFLRSWDGKAALAGNECAGVGSFCTTMFGILTTSCKTCFSTNVSTEYLPITVRPLQDHGIMQDQCH